MRQKYIERIKEVSAELNRLVIELDPEGVSEWEGFDHLYAASRDMRRINPDKLGQLPLPDYEAEEAARHLQPELPLLAAVQPGEDSLNEHRGACIAHSEDKTGHCAFCGLEMSPTPPALNETPDQEFAAIPSAKRRKKEVKNES